MKNKIKREDFVAQEMLEKHVTNYIHNLGNLIFIMFVYLFLADVVVTVLVKFGYFQFQLQSIKGGKASYNEFLIGQIFVQTFMSIPFIIYYSMYKKASFNGKKNLLMMLTITTTAVLCFGHWKNPFISFLFAIPVVITSPLDKKRHFWTLIICEVLAIGYTFFHNIYHDVENNLLFLAIASTTIVMFYLVSLKIHASFDGLFLEVKGYQDTQEVLIDKIAHDMLTGAFSKSALLQDLHNIENYKTLAFLDIDNFKLINDEKGHATGDNFLKLLVLSLKTPELEVYRYGGDEFILLSKDLSKEEMKSIIDSNRVKFKYAANELYGCDGTISVGIIDINKEQTIDENIQRGDLMMYVAKNNGRNQVAVE